MKIHVAYTVDVSDDYRRAINIWYGRDGLATREQVVSWLRTNGTSGDDDIINDLWSRRGRGEEPMPA